MLLYHTVLYHTVLVYNILYHTVLYCIILYVLSHYEGGFLPPLWLLETVKVEAIVFGRVRAELWFAAPVSVEVMACC